MQSQSQPPAHESVMLGSSIDALDIKADGVYVDATFGRGGHSRAILQRLGPQGRLVGIDRDPQAMAAAAQLSDTRFEFAHGRFSQLADILDERGIGQIDGLLCDLGVSSPQLDQAERGFSFQTDAELDMRMDPGVGEPVWRWLAKADEEEITGVIKDYGEERFARAIAKTIIARRSDGGNGAIQTTKQLADLVAGVVRRRSRRAPMGKNPATRTFQALRIFVNQELEELALILTAACRRLRVDGRLAVISFHSLEDRIVKEFMAKESGRNAPRDPIMGTPVFLESPRLASVKRVMAGPDEIEKNPRARSAVLRFARKLDSEAIA